MVDVHTHGEFNADATITASWGNQTWVFMEGSSSSRAGDGAYVIGDEFSGYTLTMRDGTVVTYSLLTPGFFNCANDGNPCHAYYFATNVAHPNGVVVKPNYRVFLGSLASGTWRVRVQSVTNNAGYQIKFNYQSNVISENSSTWAPWLTRSSATAVNNGVEYCDPGADACSLSGSWPSVSYTSASGTHTVTDSLNRATRYTYTSTSPTLSFRIKTPGSAADNIQYTMTSLWDYSIGGLVRRVTSATLGSGTWSYEYAENPPTDPTVRTITSTDPQAKQAVFTSSFPLEGWVLTSVKDPLNRTTTFSYPCTGVSSGSRYFNGSSYNVTSPEGNATIRACDARGNVTSTTVQPKTGSGLANIGTTAAFPATCSNRKTCNQPTATVDGRGAQTDYIYDPTHGGVLTVTLPAVNGVRPQKRYAYGQFYAYVRNASGALVQASSPIWMLTQGSECRTLASCTGGADEVVTSFEYGATGTVNRLLVRGTVVTSGGVSLRTCHSYDQFGNQTSVTTPRADLSVCP